MRQIHSEEIRKMVAELFLKANFHLCHDIMDKLKQSEQSEESPIGKEILNQIVKNAEMASERELAICQDTGMCVVFVELGQDVHVIGEDINSAINSGVREAYESGCLRKSIVSDLLERLNTKDNTPAVIHYEIVHGDRIKISVMPKGFGSENMSALKMLKPSDGIEGVIDFVIDTVEKAGSNPCPPIIVGVGIGGTMEKAAYLSKKALLRPLNVNNANPFYQALEEKLLNKINDLGIGPQGLGGRTTALGVNIEVFPTHIAGLPVAVNITCHASRHAEGII